MGEVNTPTRTIQQTILLVMRDVRAVAKDGYNTNQKFNFRGIDGVMNAVGPAMRDHGLIVLPEVLNREVERGQTKAGGGMATIRLTVKHTWMNEEGDSLTTLVEAEANDTADKGTAKAMSVALRTALLQVLALPTTDKDSDSEHIERGNPNQGPPLPDDWKMWVDKAEQENNFAQLAAMETDASKAGDGEARTYIATAKLKVKRLLAQESATQAGGGEPSEK